MTEEKLIDELTERTGKLCKNRIVLAIQDTSEINLTSHRNRLKPNTGLGRLDDAKGNIGFKLHPTLAVLSPAVSPYEPCVWRDTAVQGHYIAGSCSALCFE